MNKFDINISESIQKYQMALNILDQIYIERAKVLERRIDRLLQMAIRGISHEQLKRIY